MMKLHSHLNLQLPLYLDLANHAAKRSLHEELQHSRNESSRSNRSQTKEIYEERLRESIERRSSQRLNGGDSSHFPTLKIAKPISDIPEFLNSNAKNTLIAQGDFVYDEDELGDKDLPFGGPFEFDNGSVYIG